MLLVACVLLIFTASIHAHQLADPGVINIVRASPQFIEVVAANPTMMLAQEMVRTYQVDDFAVAVHALRGDENHTTLSVAHFVNTRTGEVREGKQVRLSMNDTATSGARLLPGKKTAKFTISSGGQVGFAGTVTDTGIIEAARPEYEKFATAARTSAQNCTDCNPQIWNERFGQATRTYSNELARTAGFCENAMNVLCGASGAGICFFTCAGFGVTPAGLGCGLLCGAIGAFGCANTVTFVCG